MRVGELRPILYLGSAKSLKCWGTLFHIFGAVLNKYGQQFLFYKKERLNANYLELLVSTRTSTSCGY